VKKRMRSRHHRTLVRILSVHDVSSDDVVGCSTGDLDVKCMYLFILWQHHVISVF
jgi:hypothetical protein